MKKLIAIIALFGLVFLAACTKETNESAAVEVNETTTQETTVNTEEAAETPAIEATEQATIINTTPVVEVITTTDNIVVNDEATMASQKTDAAMTEEVAK